MYCGKIFVLWVFFESWFWFFCVVWLKIRRYEGSFNEFSLWEIIVYELNCFLVIRRRGRMIKENEIF